MRLHHTIDHASTTTDRIHIQTRTRYVVTVDGHRATIEQWRADSGPSEPLVSVYDEVGDVVELHPDELGWAWPRVVAALGAEAAAHLYTMAGAPVPA